MEEPEDTDSELVYHSDWEKLVWVGFELKCPACKTLSQDETIFEYSNQPLEEFFEDIKAQPYELCSGPPVSFHCLECSSSLKVKVLMEFSRFIYIKPVTRGKKILLAS